MKDKIIIEINGDRHLLVEDTSNTTCEECSLYAQCKCNFMCAIINNFESRISPFYFKKEDKQKEEEETEIPIISEMAFKYANDKVEEKGQYIKYDFQKRKELTTFDGYEIEQSYEDGAKAMSEYFIRRFFSYGDVHIEYIKLLTKTDEINKLMDQFNNRFDRIKKSMSELDAENEKPEQELGHKEVTKKSDQVLTEFKQGLITFLTDYIDNMLNIEPEEFVEANEEKLLALASKQLDIIVHNKAVDEEIKRRCEGIDVEMMARNFFLSHKGSGFSDREIIHEFAVCSREAYKKGVLATIKKLLKGE